MEVNKIINENQFISNITKYSSLQIYLQSNASKDSHHHKKELIQIELELNLILRSIISYFYENKITLLTSPNRQVRSISSKWLDLLRKKHSNLDSEALNSFMENSLIEEEKIRKVLISI